MTPSTNIHTVIVIDKTQEWTYCLLLLPHAEPVEGIQTNGLPEESINTPIEEASYPVEEEEEEPPPPDSYPSAIEPDHQQPKTWASRLSQGIPSGGGKVVVTGSMPSPPSKLNSLVSPA